MKRLFQISLVLVLALALIVGLFHYAATSELAAAGTACRVGWNSRTTSCSTVALLTQLPRPMPQVGWNS